MHWARPRLSKFHTRALTRHTTTTHEIHVEAQRSTEPSADYLFMRHSKEKLTTPNLHKLKHYSNLYLYAEITFEEPTLNYLFCFRESLRKGKIQNIIPILNKDLYCTDTNVYWNIQITYKYFIYRYENNYYIITY